MQEQRIFNFFNFFFQTVGVTGVAMPLILFFWVS